MVTVVLGRRGFSPSSIQPLNIFNSIKHDSFFFFKKSTFKFLKMGFFLYQSIKIFFKSKDCINVKKLSFDLICSSRSA